MTIVSEAPATIDNIMAALLQNLRIHGLSLLEQGNSLIIHKNKQVSKLYPNISQTENSSRFDESDLVTQVFQLVNVDASRVYTIIRPMISNDAILEVLEETNHLVITDLASNIPKIAQLVKNLDSPSTNFEIGQYVVSKTSIAALLTLGEKILAPVAAEKPFLLVPHAPSKSIFVVSTPYLVERALSVLKTLDLSEGSTRILSLHNLTLDSVKESERSPEEEGAKGSKRPQKQEKMSPEGEDFDDSSMRWEEDLPFGEVQATQFFIYKLQYRKGNEIKDAIQKIAQSLGEIRSATNLDLIATINSVQWIESSNSLVFTGTRATLEKARELIVQIDVPVRQVLIEVLILDTSIANSLTFGVQWSAYLQHDKFSLGAGFNSGTTLKNAVTSVTTGTSPNASAIAGNTVSSIGGIGKIVTKGGQGFLSLGALVDALHKDSNNDIIMNPKIITEDNIPAKIFVGSTLRIKGQTIESSSGGSTLSTNYDYKDVGTTLSVTPIIGNNDLITLDIEQEVSVDANANTQNPDADLGAVTKKNTTKTRVHVPNNYFLVLSGMIHDDFTKTSSRLPCIGGIPVIGNLLSNRTTSDAKRSLMIFIHPRIVDTTEDIESVTKHQEELFKQKAKPLDRLKYEKDTLLEMLNLK